MARKPRIHLPGGLYHVILRGNAEQEIFVAEEGSEVFYALLDEGCRCFGYRVHGFGLMTHRVDLALQVGDKPLSRGMHNLSFRSGDGPP
jgi:REP element-mobilizing transposase RayT